MWLFGLFFGGLVLIAFVAMMAFSLIVSWLDIEDEVKARICKFFGYGPPGS